MSLAGLLDDQLRIELHSVGLLVRVEGLRQYLVHLPVVGNPAACRHMAVPAHPHKHHAVGIQCPDIHRPHAFCPVDGSPHADGVFPSDACAVKAIGGCLRLLPVLDDHALVKHAR